MSEAALIPKECVICHGRFSAKRHSAKYCSERCRKRSQRIGEVPPPAVMASGVVQLAPRPASEVDLLRVTRVALEDADRLETPMGQATLLIAEILSSGVQDTGSSIAALVRQFDASLSKALDGAARVESPLERSRRSRELRTG